VSAQRSIQQIIDGFNSKRRSTVLAHDNVYIQDEVVICRDQHKPIHCEWLRSIDWHRVGQIHGPQVLGHFKYLRDAKTNLCLSLQYVPCEDFSYSQFSTELEMHTQEALFALTKPLLNTPRMIVMGATAVLSLQNVLSLTSLGLNVLIRSTTSGLQGLQLPSDLVLPNSSTLVKANFNVVHHALSHQGINDQIYLYRSDHSHDMFVFTAGSTVQTSKGDEVTSHFADKFSLFGHQQPRIVTMCQETLENRNKLPLSGFSIARTIAGLTEDQCIVLAVFNSMVFQCAMDAFSVYLLQSPDVNQPSDERFRSFICRLVSLLVEKSSSEASHNTLFSTSNVKSLPDTPTNGVSAADVAVVVTAQVRNGRFGFVPQLTVALVTTSQDQHRLLPLSQHPYYDNYKAANKRAKRRCKTCHHPTGYYCSTCSDPNSAMFFGLCHPTTKPNSHCYFEHLHSTATNLLDTRQQC
jgi:hypothetical protein